MNKCFTMDTWDCEGDIDKIIRNYDDTCMPMPDIELQPHLLISKVRKHYMEYMVKLLSLNYETNQKLLNKNIYLPSAIWRCAKYIELNAAQMSMVVQLYRNNITQVIRDLKRDTSRGKLNRKLYECLRNKPINEKEIQTSLERSIDCNCKCTCSKRKRRRISNSPQMLDEKYKSVSTESLNIADPMTPTPAMPMTAKPAAPVLAIPVTTNNTVPEHAIPVNTKPTAPRLAMAVSAKPTELVMPVTANSTTSVPVMQINVYSKTLELPDKTINDCPAAQPKGISLDQPPRMSVESHDSDDIISKMEQMYKDLPNEDDIFEGTFCDIYDFITHDDNSKKIQSDSQPQPQNFEQGTIIEDHTAQIKSLDERLASLTGMLINNNNNESMTKHKPEKKEKTLNKWLCEQYFLKRQLYEKIDAIRDTNRKKLLWIKQKMNDLFGEDSDDEDIVSPMEETPEFIRSCKDRITPWVVEVLSPYYRAGKIAKEKALFKNLAKHLLWTIYQCSPYPSQKDVKSFVIDFLETHKNIRCEADFKHFRIENLVSYRL